ncbi:MAG TPA: autotransporter domain-containing protein, partial [Comamonas sp.]
LNASAANAISGGTQKFNGGSSLNASAANAISGGTQNFYGGSLNASAANAISGGTQNFYDGSLNASAANAISGGTQVFQASSSLNALVADAVSGGRIYLYESAWVKLHAANALNRGAEILFSGASSGGPHSNQLLLNGYSTTIGRIHSAVSGAGIIENKGSTAAVLTVDSSQQGDSSFSGVIRNGTAAALGLAKTGAGTLTLSNANTYTAGTSINGGTLVAAHNQALGTGVVSLGTAGTLQVNSGVTLTNALDLRTGGTLSGTGTVGQAGDTTTVQSGAIIRPGDASTPYGMLTVAGDLVMQSGSALQVQADPSSTTSSLLDVKGQATLAGSVLHVGPQPNAANFQVGTTYTVLTAGSINGRFASAASNFAYLNANLDYGSNTVTLKLERKASGGGNTAGGGSNTAAIMAFAELAESRNQASVANAIESLPNTRPLYRLIETLPVGAPAEAFNSLSGDSHANWQSGLQALSARASGLGPQRMHSNITAGFRPGAAIAQSDGPLPASAWPTSKAMPAWAEVVGHRQSIDGDGNAARLTQNVYGLFIGADEEVGSNGWRVGGSLGFTTADAQVKERYASADTDSYSASVYAGKGFSHAMNRINVMGGLAYTHHRISSERSVQALGQNLKAKYNAHTTQLFGEVGYAMGQYSKLGVEPFAGISINQQRVGSFEESGGFAALRGQGSKNTSTSTTLGVRAHSDFKLAGKDARVRASLGVRHAW